MPDDRVWVLAIEHRHGTELSVHRTDTSAYKAVFEWVQEWWDNEMPVTSIHPPHRPIMPTDHTKAIGAYFENVDNEDYIIVQSTIQD